MNIQRGVAQLGERSLYRREVRSVRVPSPRLFKRFDARWNEAVGLPQCPYLHRYVLVLFGRSIRLHVWHASDDQRHVHDHAWDYAALILRGGYWEIDERGHHTLRFMCDFTRYSAEHRHTVKVLDVGCWSLLFTGPRRRTWGFYIPGREHLMRPLRYFSRYGHHPCE